jgi:hypothetical protein
MEHEMSDEHNPTDQQGLRALQEMVLRLSRELHELRANAPLRDEAPATPAANVATPATPMPTAAEKRPREKLPLLCAYSGKRSDWDEWHLQAVSKLRVDGPSIGSDYDQFLYLFHRLQGDALKTVRAYVEEKTYDGTGDGSAFLAYLGTIYNDPNKKSRALRTLASLRQKENEAFANFLPRFETALANAGGQEFSEAQRVTYLHLALNFEMQQHLVSFCPSLEEGYGMLVSHLHSVGSKLASLRNYKNDHRRVVTDSRYAEPSHARTVPSSSRNTRPEAEAMDWEPTRVLKINNTQPEQEGRRAKWVSQETIAYRKQKSLCLRCGRPGHIIRNCKFLPAQRPFAVMKADVGAEGDEPVDESIALPETDDESGKE